jgi:hypothetical protein
MEPHRILDSVPAMRSWFAIVVLAAVSLSPAAQAAPAKARSILVLDLRGEASVVDASTLKTITSTVSVSVSKQKGLNVLTAQDVQNLVDVEAQKQMMGCQPGSESCLAEVASAMGADLVLSGDVGKLGANTVINLHLFDAARARSVGRDSVVVADLAQLPQLLDVSIGNLLAPVTGGAGLASKTNSVAIPTVDTGALKSGGLQAINMEAEKSLETAMDLQENPDAKPEQRRDAWCSLARVPGANPYLGPAQKACDDWTAFVVANNEIQASLIRDYQTLSAFLQLKRKTNQQRLEAVDAFLSAYGKLPQDEVESVKKARRKLADGDDDVSLPPIDASPTSSNVDTSNSSNDNSNNDNNDSDEPSPFSFGIPALNFDAVGFGFNLGVHLPVMDDITKPAFDPRFPPSFVMGMRLVLGPLEAGMSANFDFQNGAINFNGEDDFNGNGYDDDVDGNGDADDDDDGLTDEIDPEPAVSCLTAGDCTPLATPNGTQNRELAFFVHSYAGLRTISFGVAGVTLLAPSLGVDLYMPIDLGGFDVGGYVANTFGYGPVNLRVAARTHLAGDTLVRPVQFDVDFILDAETALVLMGLCTE